MNMSPLQYIRETLEMSARDFMVEYKTLSAKDKLDLKRWASEEMDVLGIAQQEKK